MKNIFFISFLFTYVFGFGQDSLQMTQLNQLVKDKKINDSTKVETLSEWTQKRKFNDTLVHRKLILEGERLCEKSLNNELSAFQTEFFTNKLGFFLITEGLVYRVYGNYSRSKMLIRESIIQYAEFDNKKGMSAGFNILGSIEKNSGNITLALEYYYKALNLAESAGDLIAASRIRLNIATSLFSQGFKDQAFDEVFSILDITRTDTSSRMKTLSIQTMLTLADRYIDFNQYDLADAYLDSTLLLLKQNDKKRLYVEHQILSCYSSFHQKEYEQAFKYGKNAHEGYTKQGHVLGIADAGILLGQCILKNNGNPKQAGNYFLEAYNIGTKSGFTSIIQKSAFHLSEFHSSRGEYKIAFTFLKKSYAAKDSLFNLEKSQEIANLKYKNQYDKKVIQDSLAYASQIQIEQVNYDAALEKEAEQRDKLYIGLAASGLLVLLILNGYQRKRRDIEIINKQKNEVEKQQRMIMDSIHYAKRIQESIAPDSRDIENEFKQFSTLIIPKEIVSGDFYWYTKLEDKIYIVLADCTGHGIPGAFMTMMGATLFNEVIVEKGEKNSGMILKMVDELIIKLLNQKDIDSSPDGMEAAVLIIDQKNQCFEIASAGINSYVYSDQLNIVKSTRRGIGGWVRNRERLPEFTVNKFSIADTKAIYLASDGIEDQFGMDGKTKFGRQALLDALNSTDVKEVIEHVENEFHKWKKDYPQMDDVSLIGIEF